MKEATGEREKLANAVREKSTALVQQLKPTPGHSYNNQRTLAAVGALRMVLNKIAPPKSRWGFWSGWLIGLISGLGLWYAIANNIFATAH